MWQSAAELARPVGRTSSLSLRSPEVRRPQPSDHHPQPVVEPPEEAACRLAAKFIGSRASSAKDHRIQDAGGHGGSAMRLGSAMTSKSCLTPVRSAHVAAMTRDGMGMREPRGGRMEKRRRGRRWPQVRPCCARPARERERGRRKEKWRRGRPAEMRAASSGKARRGTMEKGRRGRCCSHPGRRGR